MLGSPSSALRSKPSAQAETAESFFSFFKDKTPVLSKVPLPALQGLAREARLRIYEPGQYIHQAREPALGLCVILEGRACLNRCGLNGNRVSFEVFVGGDLFGLQSMYSCLHANDMQAIVTSRLAVIPREAMLRQMDRCPELARELLRVLAKRQSFLENQVLLARKPVAIRLTATLAYLYRKFGRVVPMTRAEVADLAGTTPETTMRVLKGFERRGLLRPSRRGQVTVGDVALLHEEAEP